MRSLAKKAALAVLLGVVCTTGVSFAQDGTGVVVARDRAKASPTNGEAALAYGRALRRAGREAEALTELQRARGVVAAWPNLLARVDWEIARTHIARRDFSHAMTTCRGISRIAGGAAASHVCAAEAHLLWRRGTEATAELVLAAAANDKSGEVQYAMKLAEGRARELETKDAEAEAAYREALRIFADRAEPHVLLGGLLKRAAKDALPSFRRAVEAEPHDPVAQLELGRALATGSAESIAALEKAVSERPSFVEALRALAEGYIAAKRLPDAKRTAEAVLRLAPNDVDAHLVEGRVALAEGRGADARKEGEAASKLMPNSAAAKLLIGDAWAKDRDIDLALEAYQVAFGLDRSDPTALVNAANACIAAGRPTTGRAYAARATREFPAHAPGWVALGDVLATDKDGKGAREAYETARKLPNADVPAIDQKLARLR